MEQTKQRTGQQNRALHKWFALVADTLNESGLTIQKTLRSDADVPWNETTVKELIFRPIMQAQVQKRSTRELTTKEIDFVFDTANKYFGENLGLHVPFPSIEQLILEQQARERGR